MHGTYSDHIDDLSSPFMRSHKKKTQQLTTALSKKAKMVMPLRV